MRIKTHEMEKLFALSSNGLKLYEKMGVIAPRRNAENGYRYYGSDELMLMGMATKLRGFGFSVSETADMLRLNSGDFSRRLLVRRDESISEQVAQLRQTQATIRDEIRHLDLSEALMHDARIAVKPGAFFLAFRKGDEMIDARSAERLGEWVARYTPHICQAALLNAAFLHGDGSDDPTPVSGVCVDAKIVDELGFIPGRLTYYLPPKRCIVMGVEVSNELEDMGRIRERLAQAERDLGVRSADRAFLRYYACREIDGKVVRNGLMWAPIEEADREQGQMW